MDSSKKGKIGWQEVQRNPSLHAKALLAGEGEAINWHSPAVPHSSQVVCVSAFGALRKTGVVEGVLGQLFEPLAIDANEEWTIELEKEIPELLNESGSNQPTSIDALFTCSNAVVCVEAKFKSDAKEGFGKCSQAKDKKCDGFFGPGSDLTTGTQSWCRLEVWDGDRSPRLYWSLGRTFFQAHVYSMQTSGQECPFKRYNYQLMRNFLFAAAYSQRKRLGSFGVMAIAPRRHASKIESQINEFRDEILLPEHKGRIQVTSYETYIQLLRDSRDAVAIDLADHLEIRCLPELDT